MGRDDDNGRDISGVYQFGPLRPPSPEQYDQWNGRRGGDGVLNSLAKLVAISVGIGSVIFSAAYLHYTTAANSASIADHEGRIRTVQSDLSEIKTGQAVMLQQQQANTVVLQKIDERLR